MRKLIEFFIHRHLFGDLLTVAVIGLGVSSLFWIKREAFPNVDFETIMVTTVFPGASSDEVEKLITNPLEQDLQEVEGIKKMLSTSIEGRSDIVIVLDPDQTTSDEAKTDIQDVVDRFKELPAGSEDPEVTALEANQSPVIEVTLAGDLPDLELRKIAKSLESEVESLPGVARIVYQGLRDVEIKVEADPKALSRYRLSLDDLVAALRTQNVSIPGGTIEAVPGAAGSRERIVRVIGDFKQLDDVRATVIRANEAGAAITVGKVAKVSYELERATELTRVRGLPSLSLTVLKKESADAIEVVDRLQAKLDELKPAIGASVRVELVNDISQYIRRRLSILTGNLAIGLGLVLLMLPLMIPFRFSLLVALGEPFAFLGTLLLLHVTGNSVNLISMIGLIIVSGILVDDSIVVTENAVRLVEEGKEPKEAAVEGTMQIIAPVAASVSCTIMAFLPMMFMSGIFGKFVREIPIAVISALTVSLFETFFVLPAHIAHWIKIQGRGAVGAMGAAASAARRPGPLLRATEASRRYWDDRIVPLYLRILDFSLRRRYWMATGLAILFVVSIGLATTVMKFILFPPDGIEIFFVRTEVPVGTSLQRHGDLVKSIEKKVGELPAHELDTFTTMIGVQQAEPNDPFTRRGSEFAQVTVYLKPEADRDRTADQVIEAMRKDVGTPEGFKKVVFERVSGGPPVGKPVSLGVRARTYEEILPAVAELKEVLGKIDGVTDIEDSYLLGKEEVRVRVRSDEAAAANLSVAAIGTTVRAAYEGLVATTVRELDEEMDVRVSFPRSDRSEADSLESVFVPNPAGNLVPLTAVSRFEKDQSLALHQHEANRRQVRVTAGVDTNKITAIQANDRVRALLPELGKKFPHVTIAFGGEDEDTQESMASLMRAFVAALLGIFLILVLTFKSLLQPIVILLTVPLGIIAVIWAFFLHGLPLSFMGMIGIIALAGVIVNNAVVLVDFVNQAREAGLGPMESIREGARTRVRAIFLTAVTTVIGILPTAYGVGGLDMFVVPLAMALGWGLLFGSILTALMFPASLAILDDLKAFTARKFRRRREAGA